MTCGQVSGYDFEKWLGVKLAAPGLGFHWWLRADVKAIGVDST